MTAPAVLPDISRRSLSAPAPAIEVRRLTKEFGRVPALQGVDFTVPRGGVCAVLGGAGAGKTTLLQILAGRVRPTCGEALVRGTDVAGDIARSARRVGLLQQTPRFFGWMTGREALQYAGRFFSLSAARIEQRATDLLGLVDLSAAGEQRVDDYQRGMKQRLGIAQALVGAPDVLLLDEPAAGLEPFEREQVLRTIRRLGSGVTVLLTSRCVDDASDLASAVVFLERGHAVAYFTSGASAASSITQR